MDQQWTVFVGLVLILVMYLLIIALGDAYATVNCWASLDSIISVLSLGSLPRGLYSGLTEFMSKKTVFHVGPDRFNYADAPLVCQALGAQLATADQLNDAYSEGANWCNLGWMAGQEAGYPIQPSFMQDVNQYIPKDQRGRCGNVGINGGYYSDAKLRFGVTCYGKIPTPATIPPAPTALDARKLTYDDRGVPIYSGNLDDAMKIAVIRDQYLRGDIAVTPFFQGVADTAAFKDILGQSSDDGLDEGDSS